MPRTLSRAQPEPVHPPANCQEPETAAFKAWAERWSPRGLGGAVSRSVVDSRLMFSASLLRLPEGSPIIAAVRVYRSIAALFPDGTVRSAELFRLQNPMDWYYGSLASVGAEIADASWDDKAELFSQARRNLRLREERSQIGYSSEQMAANPADQLRMYELRLNAAARQHPELQEMLLPISAANPGDINRPLRNEMRSELFSLLCVTAASETRKSIEDFRGLLDQDALKAMEDSALNGCGWYNWMIGYDNRLDTLSAEDGLRRRQATAAYPLAHCLFAAPAEPAALAVREGLPLATVLSDVLKSDKRTIKLLNGLNAHAMGLSVAPVLPGLQSICDRLQSVPAGAAPSGASEWRTYFAIDTLGSAYQKLASYSKYGDCRSRIVGSAVGKWGSIDAEAARRAAEGVSDMIRDLANNLAVPICSQNIDTRDLSSFTLREIVFTVLAGYLGETVSATRLVTMSEMWHERQTGIRAALATKFPAGQTLSVWKPLSDRQFTSSAGYRVIELYSQEMLDAEHLAMGHCVDTYGANCAADGSHILSVRTEEGRSLSTAEIIEDDIVPMAGSRRTLPSPELGRLPPCVRQHKGAKNTPPPAEAQAALWEWLAAISEGKIEIDQNNLATKAEKTAARESYASYDITAEGAVEAAWSLYRSVLPKTIVKKGFMVFSTELVAGVRNRYFAEDTAETSRAAP